VRRLLCIPILVAACLRAQTVEGSVFDASTGAPAAGVKVELLKGATPFYETTTDGGGRFRFDDVREGDFAVRYQSPDYWLTAGPSDYRTFHVAPGSTVKLETRMMPWSKISGRVVDRRGKGVPKAQVTVTGSGMTVNGRTYLRTSWGGGGGAALSASPMPLSMMGTTGADGRFEVQLMPGAYGLSVTPPPDFKPPDPDPDGPALVWKRTYYPGVTASEAATKIVVLPGGESSDIELKLAAVPAHVVRGVVVLPDGAPAGKVRVSMGQVFRPAAVESKPDGSFEFPAVAEGESILLAEVQQGSAKLRVAEWVEVARHDVENLKLQLMPSITVRGKVVMEGDKDSPPARLGPIILSLRGEMMVPGDLTNGPRDEFLIRDLYPGPYRVAQMMQPPPPPYYLHSVRAGDADLLTQDVQLSADTAITVLYKTDGGTVHGTAGKCASGGVLLVPRDPLLRSAGASKSAPCDATGYYEVRAVRPGEYVALAFAGNGPIPALDDALLNQAVKVTVRPGEVTSADLKAVTKPVFVE